ncbi:MAG: hypothetical protein O2896_05195 [Actinomycetota bacterium]|nr:hypothetical protein [Actinomycetota bacterium]
MKVRWVGLSLLLVMATLIFQPHSGHAHQPVDLGLKNITANQGPILPDGTVSFAIRANFTKPNQVRSFRAVLKASDLLNFEYLIIDNAPENKLRMNRLPKATITYPSGKKVVVKLNERTQFFEPYSRTNYLYLGRFTDLAEDGIYKVRVKSKRAARVTLAIGQREVRGEVFSAATCLVNRSVNGGADEITRGEAATLVGMSKEEARECAATLNWQFRIGAEDDEQFALTKDYRLDRVTVTIKNNFITQAIPG